MKLISVRERVDATASLKARNEVQKSVNVSGNGLVRTYQANEKT